MASNLFKPINVELSLNLENDKCVSIKEAIYGAEDDPTSLTISGVNKVRL